MTDCEAFLSTAAFWVPDYLPRSAWIEHVPFAFRLVQAMQPRRFVELGTASGCSYFAVCQAVERLGLDTRTFAIDTWLDDRETSHAEAARFSAVAAHNARYAAFSTLVRSTFDGARTEFAPGSVDLLHLDAGGSYETLKRLFESWRPAMSDDAVLLLHGSNMRQADAGASKLFAELAARYPSFHFLHGLGLGLVAPGALVPPGLRPLFEAAGGAADRIRTVYAALGDGLRTRRRLLDKEQSLSSLLLETPGPDGSDLSGDDDPQLVRLRTRLRSTGAGHAGPASGRGLDGSLPLDRDVQTDRLLSVSTRQASDAWMAAGDAMATGAVPDAALTPAAVARLVSQLADARTHASAAYGFARAAKRAIAFRRVDLGRQTRALEDAATAARAEVSRLAEEADRFRNEEAEAEDRLAEAQAVLEALFGQERSAIDAQQDGLAERLSGQTVRRLRDHAERYATLLAEVEEAVASVQTAQHQLTLATAARHGAEEAAYAAEPRASQTESAAAVMRGEWVRAEEELSALPDYPEDESFWAESYERWTELYDTLSDADRRAIRARLTRLAYRPLISVVVPVYKPKLAFLKAAIESVKAQLYERWELCLADDASPDPAVSDMLQAFAEADPRIKFIRREVNGHISAASNSALSLATGEFVALLDHDDLLAEQALFEVVMALNDNPLLDLIYSDEDHLDQYGRRNTPYFKPDYNHELMLGHNLINHLGVYRRVLIDRVGGFRLGFEGSQDYDLALRVIDATRPDRIHHIPAFLYHWRSHSGDATFSEAFLQQCLKSARNALSDHLARRNQAGAVVQHPIVPIWQRVKRALPDPAPLVSIIVPTKNKADLLGPCAKGLLERTDYPHIELIIVDHESTEPETLRLMAELAEDSRVRILPYAGVFNYSAINNAAVAEAQGSVLAFLNNDVDVINPDWLEEMVSLALLPDVGAVGAKLLYPDGRVQHAGVLLGPGGVAGHYFHLLGRDEPGYFGRAVMTAAVSAVTGACLVVRKSVFEEAGGFDSKNLPVAFNDVDLCLKIAEAGYHNVWTPHALLYHHESVSRGSDEAPERVARFQREIEFMMQKWDGVLKSDAFYNPNLNLDSADFTPGFPPRRPKPWNRAQVA